MRIPLLAAIPLCLLATLLMWWAATRDMDFLTPPSEARLSEIRAEALASLPVSRMEDDAISIKIAPPDSADAIPDSTHQMEPVDLGDIKSAPVLDTYSDRAPEGSAKLISLAFALEQAGAFQRALLAYERILDLSESDPEQIQSAVSAIRRLKPTLPDWNEDPTKATQAVLHIGTGEKFAEVLPEILAEITRDLNTASSGIVRFSHELHIGRTIQTTDAPTPVAIWITGSGDDAISTDVLSFTTDDPQTLRNDLLKTTFNLIRGHLSKAASYNPAPEALDDPLAALESHITRLLWHEFGGTLTPEP
ncbi:MAG: hypothetical protein RLZZ505_1472 [Verrucomicrobiota bacterium]|jgi:tetratricopeptide (TPR) repeat protein